LRAGCYSCRNKKKRKKWFLSAKQKKWAEKAIKGKTGYRGLAKHNERAKKAVRDLPNKDIWLKNKKVDKELLMTFAKRFNGFFMVPHLQYPLNMVNFA
jgi:hypothetical protein